MYEASDKMISLIRDNYNLLQSLGSFGISLGFGDKTVKQVCDDQNVDTNTFLAVVNFTINGYREMDDVSRLSVPTLLQYLKASHDYFLGFQLPFIRKELVDALDENDNLARLILKLYDEYSRSVTQHMKYEEKTVFPYVESLIAGKPMANYAIDMYSKHHGQESSKLRELKSIIIKYFPGDCLRNNQFVTAIHIVVAALGAHHHIRYVQACVSTTGTARRHHEVRMIVVYHLHRPYCRVYFTDATFLQHHLFGTNVSQYKIFTVLAFNRQLLKKCA